LARRSTSTATDPRRDPPRHQPGRTEALNNKVRVITRRAYGFHPAKTALALVLITCGPIALHLPHELHALGLHDTDHTDAEKA
jgi:Transposase